jgi:hypothetical protein
MRRVQRPAEEEVTIQPLTEAQLAALIDTCRGKDFYDRRDMAIIACGCRRLPGCPRSPCCASSATTASPMSIRSPG